MKNKWKWIYNPFEFVAGWKAFGIGVIVMAITAVIAKIKEISIDGVLDVHLGSFSYAVSFAMQAIILLSLFISMLIAGICFSKTKVRAIDIAGTMALARTPIMIFALICFLPIVPSNLSDISGLIIFTLISIPFVIWTIALTYNAYSVSCNLKGSKAIISFIGALLVAEILSKLVFFFLLNSLFIGNPATSVSKINSTENYIITDSLTIHQKTENVVKAFETGDIDTITTYFDDKMKKGLSSFALKASWVQVQLTYGKFEKAELNNLEEIKTDKFSIIKVPFYLNKEKINLQLAFNSDGEISGLYFRPIN